MSDRSADHGAADGNNHAPNGQMNGDHDNPHLLAYRAAGNETMAAESLSAETISTVTDSDWSDRPQADLLSSTSSSVSRDYLDPREGLMDLHISGASASDSSLIESYGDPIDNVLIDTSDSTESSRRQPQTSEPEMDRTVPSSSASLSSLSELSSDSSLRRMSGPFRTVEASHGTVAAEGMPLRSGASQMTGPAGPCPMAGPALPESQLGPHLPRPPFRSALPAHKQIATVLPQRKAGPEQHVEPTGSTPPVIGPALPSNLIGGSIAMQNPILQPSPQGFVGPVLSQSVVVPAIPQNVIGPVLPQNVVGPALPQNVMSPALPENVVGPALPQNVGGPPVPQNIIGPVLPQNIIGPTFPQSIIGPALPLNVCGPETSQNIIGPTLPQNIIGPTFPQNITESTPPQERRTESAETPDPAVSASAGAFHHTAGAGTSSLRKYIGPALPPGVAVEDVVGEDEEEEEEEESFGPMPPAPVSAQAAYEECAMEPGDVVGPMPVPGGVSDWAAEEYAHLRMQLEKKEEPTLKREDWMLKVPKKAANYGLGPRTFKRGSSATAEFDASWEDCPQAKRSCTEEREKANLADVIRDEEQRKLAEALSKDRGVSFVETHMKKGKDSKPQAFENDEVAETSGRIKLSHYSKPAWHKNIKTILTDATGERVAFDRDRDIGTGDNKKVSLDEVKERMGNLGSRFSSGGSGKKFL